MNRFWRRSSRGHEAITRNAGWRILSRHPKATLALLAFAAAICAGCPAGPLLECTDCMISPDDKQQWNTWLALKAHNVQGDYDQTAVAFGGNVSTNATIEVEALLTPFSEGTWFKIESVASTPSKEFPSQYAWFKYINLYTWRIWEVSHGSQCATVLNHAKVRSRSSPTNYLTALREDKYNCYEDYPNAFLANCKAPESPAVNIYVTQDFAEQATNLINLIRRLESVPGQQPLPELTRYGAHECLADQEAMGNYHDGAHTHKHTQQNETNTYNTYKEILDIAIWDHMYVAEKQCYLDKTKCIPGTPSYTDGHYRAMVDPKYTKIACGIYVTSKAAGDAEEGKFHAVMNFYESWQ